MKRKGERIKMKNLKNNKAITLVALIITIIVLLILAVVAISAVTGDGIILKAKIARKNYQEAQDAENLTLAGYQAKLDSINNEGNGGGSSQGGQTSEVVNAKTAGTVYSSNTVITDAYGNKIKIPAGFKLALDSGEDVTKGVVIEDTNENQFVWVPVGTIYTNEAKTESKTITLGRYINFIKPKDGYVEGTDYVTSGITIKDYFQELETSSYGNETAKSIGSFLNSVRDNGGYYIGRYEAGDSSATSTRTSETDGTLVCKAEQEVYNYIRQPDAATKCRNMYTSSSFTSDLVNSYAWDTAIVFIQEFSGETNYSSENKFTGFGKTGLNVNSDKYCNICDMSGNVYEWTTETNPDFECARVIRGGYCCNEPTSSECCTSYRDTDCTSPLGSNIGFRPIIYIGQ